MSEQLGALGLAIEGALERVADIAKARVIGNAERKFLSGDNHFRAQTFLAQLGLSALNNEGVVTRQAYKGVIDMLLAHDATGHIYVTRNDVGNGGQASSADHVLVTSRGGRPTDAAPVHLFPETGDEYYTIMSTDGHKTVED